MERTFNIPKLELENFSTYSTKELMAIAALTQSFTALHFRDNSNESNG